MRSDSVHSILHYRPIILDLKSVSTETADDFLYMFWKIFLGVFHCLQPEVRFIRFEPSAKNRLFVDADLLVLENVSRRDNDVF